VRPRLLVVAAGLLALVCGLVLVLVHSGPRRSGSNRTSSEAFVVVIGGGQQACQGLELLPADTGSLRLTIGTYGHPGPPLSVRITGPSGGALTSGSLAGGWHEGIVSIPVRHVSNAAENAKVCLRNGAPGTGSPLAIAGATPDPGYSMTVAGRPIPLTRIRIDYYRPGRESWAQLLPAIAHRMTLGKSGLIRHWAWLAAPLLMLLAIGLALRALLAEPVSSRESKA
jgi:hypothetical protein